MTNPGKLTSTQSIDVSILRQSTNQSNSLSQHIGNYTLQEGKRKEEADDWSCIQDGTGHIPTLTANEQKTDRLWQWLMWGQTSSPITTRVAVVGAWDIVALNSAGFWPWLHIVVSLHSSVLARAISCTCLPDYLPTTTVSVRSLQLCRDIFAETLHVVLLSVSSTVRICVWTFFLSGIFFVEINNHVLYVPSSGYPRLPFCRLLLVSAFYSLFETYYCLIAYIQVN